MNFLSRFVGGLIISACCVSAALGAVVDFDDIAAIPGQKNGLVPSHYQGFQWAGPWAFASESYMQIDLNNGLSFTLPSPEYLAFNGAGNAAPVTVSASIPFVFNGVFVSSWALDSALDATFSSQSISVTGFLDSVEVGSKSLALVYNDFRWLDGGWLVDELRFLNDGSDDGRWIMDNLTTNAVPEPGFWTLGLVGLILMLFRRRQLLNG